MINRKELINILDKEHIELYRENIRSMLDDAIVICCSSSHSETLNDYFNLVRRFHFDILNLENKKSD